jgi:hypothetical protein
MLPARWLELDTLPKNVNGKIDRKQIATLFGAADQASVAPPAPTTS